MSYIQNKLDEFEDRYCKFEFCDTVSKPEMENYKKFLKQSLTEAYNKGQTDYHNHIIEKLLKHFNDLESKDTDDSMNNWRNYKFIRNNIVDCLQDTNPKEL